MRKILLSFLFVFSSAQMLGQIVNVEALRGPKIDSTSGWLGKVDVNLYYNVNTRSIFRFNPSFNLRKRYDRECYFLIASGTFTSSWSSNQNSETIFERNGFLHLRYNYDLNEWFVFEAFYQLYADLPLKIDQRHQVGGGGRFRFVDTELIKAYGGALPMYELDVERGTGKVNSDVRLSTYLSVDVVKADQFEGHLIGYYQPKIGLWKDYRLTINARFSRPLNKQIALLANIGTTYDAFPVENAGIPNLTYSMNFGVSWKWH